MASSVMDAIKGSSVKNLAADDKLERLSVNYNDTEQKEGGGGRSLSNYFLKKPGSYKSGSGGGSIVTSMSDLERIEKIMTQAQYANKSIVKYFSKHLEEFKREMQYSKEIILSDLLT
jgi:hypothetical protein